MNDDTILSPAENYKLNIEYPYLCEFDRGDNFPFCGRRAKRINSETYRCSAHLPIAFNS